MYHLTVFVVAPVTPILIGRLTVELTLKLGILVAGVSAILFGFLNLINDKVWFVLVSVLLRVVQVNSHRIFYSLSLVGSRNHSEFVTLGRVFLRISRPLIHAIPRVVGVRLWTPVCTR